MCSVINQNNLACPTPVVTKTEWDGARGVNQEMTVTLVLNVGLKSFATYNNFTIYGKLTNHPSTS
jgi:hypothetical protein